MRLSQTAAFSLKASIILFFLGGSIAPTPLYAVYQAAWGFSPITITVIWAVYAVAVLTALLFVGSLSDFVGRRPLLLFPALVQAAVMAIFASARGLDALLVARVLQGLATGAAMGAAGAGMLDDDRERGTLANAVVPMLGTATGGIVSGVLVQFFPAPTRLVYAVFGAIFVAQALLVTRMPESAARRPGALASLRPRFRVPANVRRPMTFAIPALVAAWALAGFYGSLAPSVVRALVGVRSPVLSGLAVFVFAMAGAAAVFSTRGRTARVVTTLGAGSLIGGIGAILLAVDVRSIAGFFVGTAIAGVGFGGAFQGALRSVLQVVTAAERASVLSVLYAAAYLAMGLPVVLAGVGVVYGGGIFATAHEYGFGVIVLAVIALIGARLRPAGHRPLVALPLASVGPGR